VAVKIKLKRMGKMRSPHYRVVIADSRTKRDGRAIEEIGKYHPTYDPSIIEIDTDRAQYWLGVGAQPTEAVVALLKVTGDWQKFKGLPGTEGTMRFAEPKVKQGQVPFTAAGNDATTGRGKTTEAKSEPKVEAPKVTEPAAEAAAPAAEAPAEAVADAPADAAADAPAEA
jgi:small subunit ribosomal protein S16